MRKSFVVVLLTILVASTLVANDWLLVPDLRAGDIRRATSETELRKVFGTRNVRRGKIYLGEGESEDGLVLFRTDPMRKLEILLGPVPGRLAETVRLRGQKSVWKFENGVTLGTTLKELEALNGRPFILSGWGWDYSGSIYNWKGGLLEKTIPFDGNGRRVWMRLDAPASRWKVLTAAEDSNLAGDKYHDSSEIALQKVNPAITFIAVQIAELTAQR